MKAITTPLLNELSQTLRAAAQQTNDPLLIIKTHHLIRALGNIPKGFPDAPPTRPPVPPPWIAVFQEVAKAILVSLEALSRFKIVREAVRVLRRFLRL